MKKARLFVKKNLYFIIIKQTILTDLKKFEALIVIERRLNPYHLK